jgi:hypothetical protein
MNIMLDLETMGNGSTAAIIAIGAVKFDEYEVMPDGFYSKVNLESSMEFGMVVDASTVCWWMKQGEDARLAAAREDGETISMALVNFSTWAGDNPIIWGNGATFDNVILSNAYKVCFIPRPWSYKADMCYRTMKAMYPQVEAGPSIGIAHHALDDARYQAEHLLRIFKFMRGEI